MGPTHVNSLETVIKFLHTKAHSYEDPSYEPVFTSSAIFPLWCGKGVTALIGFMNYWKRKNKVDRVSCLVTVRSQAGAILTRRYFSVEQDTYALRFPDFLGDGWDPETRFIGSCELEFHSVEDLKFPYPAVSFFYETAQGVSGVHMASRVFHSVQDMDQRFMADVEESGFDLYATDALMPFFCFTNGPRPVAQAGITVVVYNARGEAKRLMGPVGPLGAYETRFVFPDAWADLTSFLGQAPGFCKVRYDSFGIFPRLICGTIARDGSHLAITHSYYDVTSRREYVPVNPDGAIRGPFRAIPLCFRDGLDVDLHFYPIYSPGAMGLRGNVYDQDGRLLACLGHLGCVVSPGPHMVRVNVRAAIEHAGVDPRASALLSIEGEAQEGRVSARINFGVNYHRAAALGTNINISMYHDRDVVARTQSYRWSPVLCRSDLVNDLLIATLSHRVDEVCSARATLSLVNAAGVVCTEDLRLKNQSSLQVRIEEVLRRARYEPSEGEMLWCVVEADSPHVTAFYLMRSHEDAIGGDHSF